MNCVIYVLVGMVVLLSDCLCVCMIFRWDPYISHMMVDR